MYTLWTSHITDPDEKAKFEQEILRSKPVIQRICDLIKKELESLEKAELNPKIYDQPNWDYRMAHGNGFKAGLNFVIKLTDLDQQKVEIKNGL